MAKQLGLARKGEVPTRLYNMLFKNVQELIALKKELYASPKLQSALARCEDITVDEMMATIDERVQEMMGEVLEGSAY